MLTANYSADTSILCLAMFLIPHKSYFYSSAPVKPVKLYKDLDHIMYAVI